jgi:AraC family transcriptional regulator
MGTRRRPEGSLANHACEILTHGEFFGIFEQKREIPHFSLALISPDEVWLKGVRHSHTTTHMVFVLCGEYVSSDGGIERLVPPRSVIFVPGGTTHQNYPRTPETRILTISVSDSQVAQAADYVRLPETESDFTHGEIASLADRLEIECDRWCGASPLTASGLCLELLAATAKRRGKDERTPPRWLQTARELLHDSCTDSVTISGVAGAAGVHPIHLSRTFRHFFHCTPGDYLRKCRIEKAASLLRLGHASIAEVALESGYTDQSQLSKAFRREFGTTPAEYRRSLPH